LERVNFLVDSATTIDITEWKTHPMRKEILAVDTKWMGELHKHDHWDLFNTDGPFRENVLAGVSPTSLSMPDFLNLRDYGKIRLLQGLEERKPLHALRDVRQLALLIQSSESLISDAVGITLFSLERGYFDVMVRHGLLQPGDWKTLERSDFDIARRAAYGSAHWVGFLAPKELSEEIINSPIPLLGICGGMLESAMQTALLGGFFRERAVGELDFSESFVQRDRLTKAVSGYCRLSGTKKMLDRNNTDAAVAGNSSVLSADGARFHSIALSRHLPYLRRYGGAEISSIAAPNFLGRYQRQPAAQK